MEENYPMRSLTRRNSREPPPNNPTPVCPVSILSQRISPGELGVLISCDSNAVVHLLLLLFT